MANFPTSLPSATPADHGEVVGELRAMASALLGLPGRNRIINGSFRTNQRAYASAGALASGSYGFDRWKSTTASSSMTFTAAAQGQLVTINSGGSFAQIIERAFVEGGTYALTWLGTSTGRVYNVGGSVPGYAASPVTVAVDGLADLTVEFTASGGARTLGEVQIEIAGPTPFERVHPALELVSCLRYYWRSSGNATAVNMTFAVGKSLDTTQANFFIPYPTPMRATPTFGSSTLRATDSIATNFTPSSYTLVAGSSNDKAAYINAAGATGMTARNMIELQTNGAGGYIEFSAEL